MGGNLPGEISLFCKITRRSVVTIDFLLMFLIKSMDYLGRDVIEEVIILSYLSEKMEKLNRSN